MAKASEFLFRGRRIVAVGVAVGVALGAAMTGCGGPTATCVPGDQKACACAGGGMGAQVCLADGQRYGECQGCGSSSVDLGAPDLNVPMPDLTVPDLAAPDLATPDLAASMPDLLSITDLAIASDLAIPPDLTVIPDLAVLPDLTVVLDLTAVPDLRVVPDLTFFPDLVNACDVDLGCGANQYCDPVSRRCVQCLVDSHCPAGRVCKSNVCLVGCTTQHACGSSLDCCGSPGVMQCTDTTTDFQNCGACGVVCQGGWNCCNRGCSNPVIDVLNCGSCGNACSVSHGTPTCSQRQCAIAKCDQGWADCNGGYPNGCETHTDVNVNNCGACNNACSLANATPMCVGGQCLISSCLAGFSDCDSNPSNGCEKPTSDDPSNCGGCGVVCSSTNVVQPICKSGACASACQTGFADCDFNRQSNGCEVNLKSNDQNCGSCGHQCPAGTPCVNGVCN